jgi:hypothetical protein
MPRYRGRAWPAPQSSEGPRCATNIRDAASAGCLMTRTHVHELTGLSPDALATYLAALGIFRLLAEQEDACVRGFWRDEHFVLVSQVLPSVRCSVRKYFTAPRVGVGDRAGSPPSGHRRPHQ